MKVRLLGGLLILAFGGLAFVAVQWHAAASRAARFESQAQASISSPQMDSSSVLPGISPELDAWLNASDETLQKADVLELNLLVAKGLPECKDINIADCKRQLDRWSDQVRTLLAQDPQGFEREREKWKTERRFELAVIGSVLKDDHGVRYVDKIDHGNLDHKFTIGIFKDGTGTCSSLPVVWTALGQRLGYPIRLAVAPEHLYCIYDDGTEKINIEATGSSHLGIRDEATIEKECPPALVKNGTFMRPLSNRELIGVFLGLRAEIWAARKDMEKALSDFQRAHELVPYNTNIASWLADCARMVASKHPVASSGGRSLLQSDDAGDQAYRDYVRAMRAQASRNYGSPAPGGPYGLPGMAGPSRQGPDPYGPQVPYPRPGERQ
jgi:hypothetical protein